MHVKIRKRIGNPTLYNAKINYSHIEFVKYLIRHYGKHFSFLTQSYKLTHLFFTKSSKTAEP